mgnify:CR=1 FL=1
METMMDSNQRERLKQRLIISLPRSDGKLEAAFHERIQSDDVLGAGRIQLIFAERPDAIRIPGKTVQGKGNSILRQEIADILKQHIQVAGEEAARAAGGGGQERIDPPDADGFVPIESEGGGKMGLGRPAQVTGSGAQPAGGVAQQAVKTG